MALGGQRDNRSAFVRSFMCSNVQQPAVLIWATLFHKRYRVGSHPLHPSTWGSSWCSMMHRLYPLVKQKRHISLVSVTVILNWVYFKKIYFYATVFDVILRLKTILTDLWGEREDFLICKWYTTTVYICMYIECRCSL